MNAADWNNKFGNDYLITLTNEERRYLALAPISLECDSLVYHSKTNLWYTRVTAFFDGNTIIKVICETKRVLKDGNANYENYVEYDTKLITDNRTHLLPQNGRGKTKPLSASNINAVTPFGCSLSIVFEAGNDTFLSLSNPRAYKKFPIGEWDTISEMRSDTDFHAFMKNYIATCKADYFEKLQAFQVAKKVTVKYKPGDIFRMDFDRTHYCYGIITADIKKLKAMQELPEKHSLRPLMTVPIMVRYYQLITDNPNLKANELCQVTLGRVNIVADNDIIWGTHTIVDHKPLDPDDLEFNFVCTKIISHSPHATVFTQDMFMRDGLIPKQEYLLYIEWGFAQTSLSYEKMSDKLKEMMVDYRSPHGGVLLSIDPREATVNQKHRQRNSYKNNLLNSENREILNEIFFCLGLNADTTFDQFAKEFGGLSNYEIISRMK